MNTAYILMIVCCTYMRCLLSSRSLFNAVFDSMSGRAKYSVLVDEERLFYIVSSGTLNHTHTLTQLLCHPFTVVTCKLQNILVDKENFLTKQLFSLHQVLAFEQITVPERGVVKVT